MRAATFPNPRRKPRPSLLLLLLVGAGPPAALLLILIVAERIAGLFS